MHKYISHYSTAFCVMCLYSMACYTVFKYGFTHITQVMAYYCVMGR